MATSDKFSADHWADIWASRHLVLSKTGVTYRYHRKRQRFFDLLDKGTKAATVLLGASLLGATLHTHLPLVAASISSLGLLALVFGYGDRKQAHKELAEASMLLVSKIEKTQMDELDKPLTAIWLSELAQINAKEPPALKTLVIICEHEEAASTGYPDHVPMPSWPRRLIADFF